MYWLINTYLSEQAKPLMLPLQLQGAWIFAARLENHMVRFPFRSPVRFRKNDIIFPGLIQKRPELQSDYFKTRLVAWFFPLKGTI